MNNQVQLPSIQNLLNSLNHDDNKIDSKINIININITNNNNNSNSNNSNSNNIPIFLPDPFKNKIDINRQNKDPSNDIQTLIPLPSINTMSSFKPSSGSSSSIANNNKQSIPYSANSFTSVSLQQYPSVPRINPEKKSITAIQSIISNTITAGINSNTMATTKDRNDSNEIKGTIYSKSSSRKIVTAKTIPCKINYEKDGLKIISRKHCRYNLPKDCVTILNDWLMNHLHNPYPTAQEKRDLLIKTGLTKIQLSNWFINQRRRKIFSGYYSMAKSISDEKGNNDLPCDEVKVPLTKRKKLMDRIDELKQLMGEESS
ncbi:homeobox domain-containing protein PWA37_005004 [Arxiozyma heterogenica]|uniref:homeobox domain-containing protein n=1 Tax=Arxiozyma heterogenica TaxID=278026 RepID=UPI002EDE1F9F